MGNSVYIDGVNVAECDCYDNTYCLWSKKYHEIMITPKCEIVKDCYFKQLQRAKAEKQDLINYFKLREGGMQEDIQYWKNKAQEQYRELEQLHKKYYHILNLAKQNADSSEYCMQELEAENEKLKSRNKLYKKVIVENQQKFHNQILILKACIKGEFSIDDFKNFAKVIDENKRLKADNNKMKDFIKWLLRQQYYILHQNIKEKIKELILTLSP